MYEDLRNIFKGPRDDMRNCKDGYCREDVEKIIAGKPKHQVVEAKFVAVLPKYSNAGNISNNSDKSNHNLMMQR